MKMTPERVEVSNIRLALACFFKAQTSPIRSPTGGRTTATKCSAGLGSSTDRLTGVGT